MVRAYLQELLSRFGRGWTQFWFNPIDPLTLCWLRILSGGMLCYWLATITPDLLHWFGPQGLVPVETVRQMMGSTPRFSYLDYLSAPSELWSAHVVALAVAVCFTLGLLTRVSAVLSLVIALSYMHRAPMITDRMEPVLVMVLAYLCLAPCGAYLSLDRLWKSKRAADVPEWKRKELNEPKKSVAANIATRLTQLHLAAIYAMMALAQLQGAPWWEGTAIWWLMANDSSRLIDLTALQAYPDLIHAWTHGTWLAEFTFPILVWHPLVRPLVLIAVTLMWVYLIAITGLVSYGLMMIFAGLAFVSPGLLKRADRVG